MLEPLPENADQIQIYSLDALVYRQLLEEHPDYKRMSTLRATNRRSHFLGILEQVKDYYELRNKQKEGSAYEGEFSGRADENLSSMHLFGF